MARQLAQMSRWPTVIPNITPDVIDLQWGAQANEKLDIYRGPGSSTAPRRLIAAFSFGGGTQGDHRQPSVSGFGGSNALAWYYTRSPVAEAIGPTDFVSVNYEKFRWDNPTPCTHIPQYVSTPNPTTYPTQRTRLAAFFTTYLPSVAVAQNWDLNKVHAFGSSHGGVLLGLQLFNGGLPIRTLTVESPIPDYRSLIVYWATAEGMFGDGNFAAWAARSLADKNSITQLLKLGTVPATYRPMYILNNITGNAIIPYGDPANAGGSIHDLAQWEHMKTALLDIGADFQSEAYQRGAWQDPLLGAHDISRRVVDWQLTKE